MRAPFGEESFWPGWGLMSHLKRAFAGLVLPARYDAKAETEPKHNIVRVF